MVALFQYDQFGAHDARMAALSLMAMALGLPAFIFIKVLAPAFYARQDTATPVRIGIIAMIANMGLNLLFVLPMLYLEIAGPHAGLALATTCSAWLNAGMLYRRLRQAEIYAPRPGWRPVWVRVLAGSAVMIGVLGYGVSDFELWVGRGSSERLMHLGMWITVAGAAYLGALQLLGQNLHQLWQRPDMPASLPESKE